MSSSSDTALTNPVNTTINLPSIDNKELFEDRLEECLRDIATKVNTKEGGLYSLAESITFKQYFTEDDPQNNRNTYRKSFDLTSGGNIASSATVTPAHGITNLGDAILIYVSCVTTTNERFTAFFPDVCMTATTFDFTNPHTDPVSSAIGVAEYTKS